MARNYSKMTQSVERLQNLGFNKVVDTTGYWKVVVAMAYRVQLLRELQILTKYDGDEAKALTTQRSGLLAAKVDNVVSRYFMAVFGKRRAIVRNATKLSALETKKQNDVLRLATLQQLRLLVNQANVTAEEVLSFVASQTVLPRSSQVVAGLWSNVETNRRNYDRFFFYIFLFVCKRVLFASCGLSRECKNKEMNAVAQSLIKLWMSEPPALRDNLMKKQSMAFQACSVECAFASKMLWEFAMLAVRDASVRTRIGLAAFALYCATDDCVHQSTRAVTITLNSARFVRSFVGFFFFSFNRSAFETAGPTQQNFADRGISLAGIIVCCFLLAVLTAVVVLGVLWKTLFGRFIWILLLAGMFAIVIGHLYIWVVSFFPPPFDLNQATSISSLVGYTVGFFARLVVLYMILVLLYFFLHDRRFVCLFVGLFFFFFFKLANLRP
jgi:hypothetical protein